MSPFNIADHIEKLEPDGGKDRRSGDKSYVCPSCSGHNFLVNEGTGEYYCVNGCTTKQVRDAIEPPINPDKKEKVVEKEVRPQGRRTWDYFTAKTLELGYPAVRVVRTDDGKGGKNIHQESLIAGIDKPKPIIEKLLPYGIEYAREAVARGELVFNVEGEQCVDALRGVGIAAITYQGGSGGLKPERDAGHIPAENLVISPDQDTAGVKYADKIAELYPGCSWFYPFPGDARWNGKMPASKGVDIADWIALGATKEQILKGVQKERLDHNKKPSETTEQLQPFRDATWVKQQLRELVDAGLTKGEMTLECIKLAELAAMHLSSVKELLAGVLTDDADAEDAEGIKEVITQSDKANEGVESINLEHYFPKGLCDALRVFQRGIPYGDLTMLMAQLAATSGCLKLGTRINGNPFTAWEVPMNTYIIDVGPSGARKTPLLKSIIKQPTGLIREQIDILNEQRFKAWEDDCLARKGAGKPKQPMKLVHTTNSYTSEGLEERLEAHEKHGLSLLIVREEVAALFESFGKYKQGGKGSGGDEQQMLELFDGDGHDSTRCSGGRGYSSCHVSLYGGIQDDVLHRLVASGDANGKWARCIFVPLPEMTYLLPDVTDADIKARRNAEAYLSKLALTLWQMAKRTYQLDAEGIKTLKEYDFFCQKQRNETSVKSIKALKNKSAGKVLRIAGLLHVLHCNEAREFPITVPSDRVLQAMTLVDTLDSWTASLHATASLKKDAADAVMGRQRLLRRIHEIASKSKGPVPWKTIREALKGSEKKGITAALAQVMMTQLEDMGLGLIEKGQRGGASFRAWGTFP